MVQRQLKYFNETWGGGLKFNLDKELRLFGISLCSLLVLHLVNIILCILRDKQSDELTKLRLSIALKVMFLLTDITNKISSIAIVYV